MTRQDDPIRDWTSALAALAQDDEACPHADEIFEAATGELAPERVRQLVDHSLECPACADAWFVARERSEDLTMATPMPPPLLQPSRRPAWLAYGGLIAAALALTLGIQLMLQESGPGDGAMVATRGTAESEPVLIHFETAEGAVLPRDQCEVRWQGPAGARYRVDVSVSNEVSDLATSGSDYRETRFRVSPSDLASVAPGEELVWIVKVWTDATEEPAERARLTVSCD